MQASPIIFMLLMFAVFWFILIRPQVKKQKEHQALLSALKKGDTVVTRGGFIGKISGISDNVVTLELQEKVRVRVLRAYIDGKYDPAKLAGKKDDKKAA
ncbi:MAG: preprotein translocase subunit YajC [Deltaproteobacteria bacterium]|nr:preprotein translocase subunit YajC [Deltaproteobacteria bacterium]